MSAYIELIKEDTILYYGATLYRIRAKKDIDSKNGYVPEGTVGGYVENPDNLQDYAWVTNEAKLSGNARAADNARIEDRAEVCADALIHGTGTVSGGAIVGGQAVVEDGLVTDRASVRGDAIIRGTVRNDVQVLAGCVPPEATVLRGVIRKWNCCVVLLGLRYKVTITPGWMMIGCQFRTMDEWFTNTDEEFLMEAGGSDGVEFWQNNCVMLKHLCDEVTKNDQD